MSATTQLLPFQPMSMSWAQRPVVVAKVASNEGLTPVGVSEGELLLKAVPVTAGSDHQRSLDAFGILPADNGGREMAKFDEHTLRTALRKSLSTQGVRRRLTSLASMISHA